MMCKVYKRSISTRTKEKGIEKCGNVFFSAAPRKPISFRTTGRFTTRVVPLVEFDFPSDQNLQGTHANECLVENLIKKADILFSFLLVESKNSFFFKNIYNT